LYEDPVGEVNWINLSNLKYDNSKDNTAYFLDANDKKLYVNNVRLVDDGKVAIFEAENRNKRITNVPMNMTWMRSNDIHVIKEKNLCKLSDDPAIINMSGNFTHEFGVQV